MADTEHIFISYTHADQAYAISIYNFLKSKELSPWIDCKQIKGGQNWDFEIKAALNRSIIVLVLWSQNSRDRRGYVQREIKIALDNLQEKHEDDIYIIPILLEDNIEIPNQLNAIQCLKYNSSDFLESLNEAISHQLERIGKQRNQIQEMQDVYWKLVNVKESWEGLPGYENEIELLEFSSKRYNDLDMINIAIKGYFYEQILSFRNRKLSQDPSNYNYAQEKWARTDTFYAQCGDPVFCGSALSISYNVSTYGAGAAHPVHFNKTFVFLLAPLLKVAYLQSVFVEKEEIFKNVQELVRRQLRAYFLTENSDTSPSYAESEIDSDWINNGTESWDDLRSFVFGQNGIDIFFSSYQVACYAAGTPTITLLYSDIAKIMRREYVTALGIERHYYGH